MLIRSLPSLLVLPAAIAWALPGVAQAQATGATDLDEVVVTGTRTEVPLADSLVPAQVIDRDEIERSQARSLVDLLKGRAGVGFTNQGGLGKLTTINLRGTESDHVLVLVDGVRIGSATAGLAMFQDLPVDQIERIEIIRGPRSSLYGSEAIGGVIQIFTRNAGPGLDRNFRIGGGSNHLREASAGFGYRGERGWVGANAAWQETDGFNACRGSGTLFQGCFADEPDDDGYRNVSLNLRAGFRLADTLELDGHVLHADAFNEFDGTIFGGNEADNVQQVLGTRLAWTPSARTRVTAQLGRASDKSTNHFADAASDTRSFVSTFDTRRDTASLQGDFGLGDAHLLSAGADWQRDEVTSSTTFLDGDGTPVDGRDNTGVFVEYQGRFGAQQLQASVRNDDNEQFGNHATGSLGWGMQFGDGFRLAASYGTAFKAPTFNDLYYPFGLGNPDLKPETSRSANIGISQHAAHWSWTLDAYETRIDDLISYDAARFQPNNIDKARIRGVEFTVDTTLAGWDFGAQLSHTDPRSESGSNDGKLLARRARDTGRIDLDRAFGAFRFGATLNASGPRYDDAANTVRLGGFATTDLRFEYAFHNDWTLQARASNVFDRHYETVAWYNQPGREFGLSLRYAPK